MHIIMCMSNVPCMCIHALRMGPLPAGLLQEKAIPAAAEPPRVWPSEVHTCIELE